MTDEGHKARRFQSKLSSAALRHVAPQHLDRVLDHYAAGLRDHVEFGHATSKEVDCMPYEAHEANIQQIAKDNPHVRPPPTPKAPPLPSVQHRRGTGNGDYSQLIEQAKAKGK
jgi:hypothetical protein